MAKGNLLFAPFQSRPLIAIFTTIFHTSACLTITANLLHNYNWSSWSRNPIRIFWYKEQMPFPISYPLLTMFSLQVFYFLLTLSQTTNSGLFQTQRVCRRQFQIWWKWQKCLQMVRKRCGKRRNCSLRAISPFPTVFSKDLYYRHVKTRACLGKS